MPGLVTGLHGTWNLVTASRRCRRGSVGIDGGFFMKTGTALATALLAAASFPLLAQQSTPANQPDTPATQQKPTSTEPATTNSPASAPEAPAAEMSPVNGELVSKLDSKTAKAGDNFVIKTKSNIKTADGTEIPKGSKLIGHVLVAQPSNAGANSQVALQIDHIELKGGQSLPVHSQIQSIAPPDGSASTGGPAPGGAVNGSAAPASPGPALGAANGGSRPSSAPRTAAADPATAHAGDGGPAAGTVVAKNGNIAISTTSIPGVLLANNVPGQQDPRMAQASSILLGAKRDIELDGGTQMVVGVSASSSTTK